ncbi:hypothetical protein EW146_g6530 [Bondarzewia mesenterica]|uniref:Uncharacterized protein n=1 Tax=Bondarzewia mesenterica TaxID=1095465 RepID=A0A4S4LQ56_9AGAM|nr:hypothetical protein EW146_g6530 [Bondarzewia mesenterica]
MLNRDVHLENFLVISHHDINDTATPRWLMMMLDFAQCRLRWEDEDDREWKREKWSTDEEGAIGYPLKQRFGWEYRPTWKYMVEADDMPI